MLTSKNSKIITRLFFQQHAEIICKLKTLPIFALFFSAVLPAYLPNSAWADTEKSPHKTVISLTDLSLEELMNVEVISSSKKLEKISEAAAAIFVISQEDIRRSGVTTIPEALRMVPGVHVARIDANKWAVTARGFNDRFASKLLVLTDGRSVYSPLFSGVFWELQDTMLEDIERIEVIRGPGSTLWGANAVNGVINIITKNASKTQGGLATAGGGTEERGFGAVRYGGKAGDSGYYRVYGKYFNRDGFVDSSGNRTPDDWYSYRGGFRADWEPNSDDLFTVQGDIYSGRAGQTTDLPTLALPYLNTVNTKTDTLGLNLTTRWKRTISETSELALQFYYDRTQRKDSTTINEDRDTFDLDLQHSFAPFENHKIVWGMGYHFTQDQIDSTFTLRVNPASRKDSLFSSFIQDDITLLPDVLRLTLGSKFENNDYSGFEVQPTARLLFTPNQQHSIWGAVSRAVRTPSRVEADSIAIAQILPPNAIGLGSPLGTASVYGNTSLASEKLIAYEIGYRLQPAQNLFFDLALFYNKYDKIISTRQGTFNPFVVPAVLPYTLTNNVSGETHGAELAVDWRSTEWWHQQLAYTYLRMKMHPEEPGSFSEYIAKLGTSPEHQLSYRSGFDLTKGVHLDLWLRYVDTLPREIKNYVTMDARLAWKPEKSLELSLVGQNLFEKRHQEFGLDVSRSTLVPRGFYGKVSWQF
jgi:iron complex outermembrane recepter protein